MTQDFSVVKIDKKTAKAFIEPTHYRKTLGIFWEGFALVIDNKIEGVVCYGQPSPPIQKHAFANRDFRLYELTRLVIQTKRKNAASILVGQSLQLLSEQPCAVISYADSSMGHVGIVYQATNWIYTGSAKAHDKMYIVDGLKLHPTTIRDRFGVTNPIQWARENGVAMVDPEEKHRYFYILGNKIAKAKILFSLKYPVIKDYPKCTKVMYDAGPRIEIEANQDNNFSGL